MGRTLDRASAMEPRECSPAPWRGRPRKRDRDPRLSLRIGAHDDKLLGLDEAMGNAGGNGDHIAAFELGYNALRPAKPHFGPAPGNAKHLMRGRLVMIEIVDAVDPDTSPAIRREQCFEGALGRAAETVERKCLAIEHERQLAIIGNDAVIGENVPLYAEMRQRACPQSKARSGKSFLLRSPHHRSTQTHSPGATRHPSQQRGAARAVPVSFVSRS